MIKKVLKSLVIGCMTISMLATNVTLPVFANDNITDSTTTITYTNELPGFNGKDVEIVSSGYKLGDNNGNNLAISALSSKEFTFEADVTYLSGANKTSFVLGAGSSDYTTVGNGKTHTFFGLEIWNDGGNIKIKMFQDGPSGLGDNVIAYTPVTTTSDSTIALKVSYTNANNLEVWIDDVKANFTFAKDFNGRYNGGYLGLLSFDTAVKYENIHLTIPNNSVYENELTDLVGTQISALTTGYKIGNNDTNNHSVSQAIAEDWEFEASATYNSGDRFSFVFGAANTLANVKEGKFFGLEFMVTNGEIKSKLFLEKPNTVYFKERSLGSINSNSDVKIKASLVNGVLKAKINDNEEVVLLDETNNAAFLSAYGNGGNLGFLTWKSEVDLENLKVTTLGTTSYEDTLPELRGADVTPLIQGYRLFKGGNNIAVSSVSAKEFTFSANFKYENGRKTTLLLGAQDDDWSTLGRNKTYTMFGIEFDKNGNTMTLKMFQDGPNSLGDRLATGSVTLDETDDTIKVEVSYSEANGFVIEIDDKPVTFNVPANVVNAYVGGYIGFLTYETTSFISDIKIVAKKEEAGNFITNLTNVTGLNGTWGIVSDGLYSSGNGDLFALSETVASDFIYEADIKFGSTEGAAALVFRSGDTPGSASYVANILKKDGRARLFKFPGGVDVGTATIDTSKDTYHLKVMALGSTLCVYLDDELIIAGNDNTYSSGKLGLLTWNSTATYQNVNYTPITEANIAKLTDLTLTSTENVTGFTFTPTFSTSTMAYEAFLPAEATKMDVCATAESDTSLSYKIISANGVVTDQANMTSGTKVTVTPPIGTSKMIITATKGDISTSYLIGITKKTSAKDMASEDYRPQVHFSPEINFMNDPNGLMYDPSNKTWHMYFQYSPQLHGMGSQTWGHAVSDDLVNWVEMPVAIPMENLGAIFSGSGISLTAEEARNVVDRENNNFAFFTEQDIENFENGTGSLLVALYTTTSPQQDQSIAYSTDHGVTWTQYDKNPIIKHDYTSDRDPKVFKVPGDDRWYLIVAGGYARLYVSDNLINWTLAQDLTWPDGSLIHSECPDMYPLAVVDRSGNATGETKWVYNASSEWYVVGDMVKNTTTGYYEFKPVTGVIQEQTGDSTGSNAYAAQSYYNDGTGLNRRITVHWMQDYSTRNGIDKRWNGAQSLPLETKLQKLEDGSYTLVQTPVKEVETLRGTKLYDASNTTVKDTDPNILSGLTAQVYEVIATFDMDETTASEFGFELRTGDGEKVVYKYDAKNKKMILDKSQTGNAYDAHSMSWTLTPTSDNKIKLRAIVDQSVIETFGNDGEAHLIDMCYPSPSAVGMSFYSKGGDVKIEDIKVYELKSIYTKDDVSKSAKETYITLVSDAYVEKGVNFTVSANVYPMSDIEDVEWTIPAGLTKVSETDNTITLVGNTDGTYTVNATVNGKAVDTSITVDTKEFNTNLTGWNATSGSWEVSFNGILAANSGIGDSYYVSNAKLKPNVAWIYEADMIIESGQAGGLLFGVKNPSDPGSHWMCLNSDLGTNNNFFKFFKITGNDDFNFTTPHGQLAGQNAYHFRLEYDGNGLLTFKVAPYGTTNYVVTNTKQDNAFAALSDELYFGLVSYRGNVSFDNVYLTTVGATVESIIAPEDITLFYGNTEDDLLALLPETVTGKKTDGNTYSFEVGLYDTSDVDFTNVGSYIVKGSAAEKDFEFNVIIKEVIESITTPANITVSVNTSLEDFEALLPETVKGLGTDGKIYDVEIGAMNYDNVDLSSIGTYAVEASAGGIDFSITVVVERGIDITELMELMERLGTLDPEDYTEASANRVTEMLEIIVTLYGDMDTTQQEFDESVDRLENAIDSLVSIVSLKDVINEVENTDTSNCTEASVKKFEKALEVAKEALVGGSAEEVEAAEKALVDAYNALDVLRDYEIIEGNNATWMKDAKEGLTFKANGDIAKFVCVEVDDKVVDVKYYTVKAGSTVVTFTKEYLETLSVGTHKITVVYTNGEASANFTIKANTATSTGDPTNVAGLITMLLASAYILTRRKRA